MLSSCVLSKNGDKSLFDKSLHDLGVSMIDDPLQSVAMHEDPLSPHLSWSSVSRNGSWNH
jgi:hypothetical protein